MNKKLALKIGIPSAVVLTLTVTSAVYLTTYMKAVGVESYLTSSESVTVTHDKNGYFFDGYGSDDYLIFYPGAKVDTVAYAPLLYSLAEKGIDTYLVDMPFHMAIFGVSKAETVMKDYPHTYLMGHSMGGAMVASFVEGRTDIDGIIFLAAYSANDLTTTPVRALSIYGSNDGVLTMSKVEKGRTLISDYTEFVIDGGNHAGFASYGKQSGDKEATISGEKQVEITIEQILSFVKGL